MWTEGELGSHTFLRLRGTGGGHYGFFGNLDPVEKVNIDNLHLTLPSSWLLLPVYIFLGSSQVSQVVKNPPASVGDERDSGSIPGMGKSSGGRNDNPLQYCCLENPMDRGAWQATESQRVRHDWWDLAHRSAHTVDTPRWQFAPAFFLGAWEWNHNPIGPFPICFDNSISSKLEKLKKSGQSNAINYKIKFCSPHSLHCSQISTPFPTKLRGSLSIYVY